MLDPATWLSTFLTPDNTLEIAVFGHTRCSRTWVLGPRNLPEDLIYVLTDGVVEGNCASQPLRLEQGAAFWMPAGTEHHLHTVPNERPPTVYHLRVRHQLPPQGVILTRRSEAIRAAMVRLFDDYQSPLGDHEPRLRANLTLLLSEFLRTRSNSGGHVLDAAQRKTIHLLVDRCAAHDRLHPRDLAQAVDRSPAWFSRVFTRTYGCSPRTWLKRRRLEQAANRLVESGESISAIAEAFGYDELFRFSRQFREVLGCSPRTWRQRHQAAKSAR